MCEHMSYTLAACLLAVSDCQKTKMLHQYEHVVGSKPDTVGLHCTEVLPMQDLHSERVATFQV
jgi:hypothetical protein